MESEEHLEWFLPKLAQVHRRVELKKQLQMAECTVIAAQLGSKEGNRAYQRWHRNKVLELESLVEKEETVFDRLRNQGSDTIFGRLKRMRRSGKHGV